MYRKSEVADIPIGSTQNVGASVRAGRVPAEYDSSPMLLICLNASAGLWTDSLQSKLWVLGFKLAFNEFFNFNVVLCHQVY